MLLRDEYTVTPLDLDLPLTVSPSMVSPTRRIIEAKLGPVLEDEDAIFRVAMTAHELLENAAKYASDGKARLELSVTPRDEGRDRARRRHQQLDAGTHRRAWRLLRRDERREGRDGPLLLADAR